MRSDILAVLVVAATILVPPGVAGQDQSDPFFEHMGALNVVYGAEMITIRLAALSAFGHPPPELVDNSEKMLTRDLPRFRGSLDQVDAALGRQVESAITDLIRRARSSEAGGLAVAILEVRDLTLGARDTLVPSDLRADPAFVAALVKMLLLANDGVAEAYEDAAGGDPWEYPNGWAALRRTRELLTELRPRLDEDAAADVDETVAALAALFPSPGPPDLFRGDPEEAEAPAHRIAALLEREIGVSLFPDRDRPSLLERIRSVIDDSCVAYGEGSPQLALQGITSAHFFYDEYLRPIAGLFAQEPDARARGGFDHLLGHVTPEDGVGRCEDLSRAIGDLQEVLGS